MLPREGGRVFLPRLRAAAVVPVTCFSFIAMLGAGMVDVAREWLLLLAVLAVSTVGVQLGGVLHHYVDHGTVSTLVLVLLAVTATTLLAPFGAAAQLCLLAVVALSTAAFVRALARNCTSYLAAARAARAEAAHTLL